RLPPISEHNKSGSDKSNPVLIKENLWFELEFQLSISTTDHIIKK
ncbi:unnamed protein product, partial [Allacma fusca]